jgi:hypothetical protein
MSFVMSKSLPWWFVSLYNHKVHLNPIIYVFASTENAPFQECTASFLAIFHF